jgi:hypothetical protein
LSRLKESNGRAEAKPAISISVYRPATLAQTLNAAKCLPSVELEPSPFVALAMKLETTNKPLFLEGCGCAELGLRRLARCEAH